VFERTRHNFHWCAALHGTALYELALALDGETTAPKNEARVDGDDDDLRFIGDGGLGVELGPSWLERRSAADEVTPY
jgi:hypothetical protein